MSKGYPSLLIELMPLLSRVGKQFGLIDTEADKFGFELADRLRNQFGGRQIYVPIRVPRVGPRYEVNNEICALATACAKRAGFSKLQAKQAGEKVAQVIRQHWGGNQTYLAKGTAFNLSQRNNYIRREYNGKNCRELARQFDISERQIYSIIRAGRLHDKQQTRDENNK